MANLQLIVDDSELVRMARAAEGALGRAIDMIAETALEAAQRESQPVSSRIAGSWSIEDRGAARAVTSSVWWAHFPARGTRAHGPRSAQRLLFTVDGHMVGATFVSGVPANPFHERAADTTESRLGEIIQRVMAEVH